MIEQFLARELTAVDGLGGLLLDSACVVLLRRLISETSSRAIAVEVAAVVHGPLQDVALPAEEIVTVGSRTSVAWSVHVHCGFLK